LAYIPLSIYIEYGGPYWQIFWPHLSLDRPPAQNEDSLLIGHIFLHIGHQWCPKRYQVNYKINDYSIAARNMYDILSMEDALDEVDANSDNEEHWSPEEPNKKSEGQAQHRRQQSKPSHRPTKYQDRRRTPASSPPSRQAGMSSEDGPLRHFPSTKTSDWKW
jgi:hypothetical protein